MTPPGLAKFDSASAMLLALGRLLHGRDFRGLGQSFFLRQLVPFADWIPRRSRERLFARMGAGEGVAPDKMGDVNAAAIADWACRHYPAGPYPAVMVGSSNGALMHMAAALRIPWLPQTFLTLVRQPGIHPDDAMAPMKKAMGPAERFLAANPDIQLHHMHDPVQDRLMLSRITYFRFKYRRLPMPYRRFLENCLQPGGSILIINCKQSWRVTRIGPRHVYQFGAVGGADQSDYLCNSERVRQYLERSRSPFSQWQPPVPDGDSPEAEWGFEQALAEDISAFARERGYRVLSLDFDDPESLSPVVADFHRRWYEELGIKENRLLFESFIVLEPYWTLRTGTVPFWMSFNTDMSLRAAEEYLAHREIYDHLYLMLFAHGSDSIGLPPVEAWCRLLERGKERGDLLGVNPSRYPAHFSVFAKYSAKLRSLRPHYPVPPAVPLERLEDSFARWIRR